MEVVAYSGLSTPWWVSALTILSTLLTLWFGFVALYGSVKLVQWLHRRGR